MSKTGGFVKYDASVDFEFRKLPNLGSMDNFLLNTWVPRDTESVSQFLKWYFNLPVYSLKYSDNSKAVSAIKTLFR